MSDDLVKRLRDPGVGSARWVLVERPLLVAAADLIEAQAARIAELKAALRDVLPYVDTCNSSHREAQAKGYAALEGRRDDPAA